MLSELLIKRRQREFGFSLFFYSCFQAYISIKYSKKREVPGDMQRRFFKLVCGAFLGLSAICFFMPSPILHAVVWIGLGTVSLMIIIEMWKVINTWGTEEEWDEDP